MYLANSYTNNASKGVQRTPFFLMLFLDTFFYLEQIFHVIVILAYLTNITKCSVHVFVTYYY